VSARRNPTRSTEHTRVEIHPEPCSKSTPGHSARGYSKRGRCCKRRRQRVPTGRQVLVRVCFRSGRPRCGRAGDAGCCRASVPRGPFPKCRSPWRKTFPETSEVFLLQGDRRLFGNGPGGLLGIAEGRRLELTDSRGGNCRGHHIDRYSQGGFKWSSQRCCSSESVGDRRRLRQVSSSRVPREVGR
jgi:hypothetical protein